MKVIVTTTDPDGTTRILADEPEVHEGRVEMNSKPKPRGKP